MKRLPKKLIDNIERKVNILRDEIQASDKINSDIDRILGLQMDIKEVYQFYQDFVKPIYSEIEAKRYFFNFNEVDDNWSSNGKVHIKQDEVCDMEILV